MCERMFILFGFLRVALLMTSNRSQLEVLPKADLIITMADGRIAEMGTYDELLRAEGAMAKLLADHLAESLKVVNKEKKGVLEDPEIIALKEVHIQDEIKAHADAETNADVKSSAKSGALITKEERTTGALGNSVYIRYIRSMGSLMVSDTIRKHKAKLTTCIL